jgi:spore maturation protein CgeB
MTALKKINKILFAETKSKHYAPYQSFYKPLERSCKKLVSFDTRWNYFVYGKEKMNDMLLETIQREKPDYVFMWVRCDEYNLKKLLKIREISPITKVCLFFGDDDEYFDVFSRYFILFLDYGLIAQKKYMQKYNQDRIKNVFFMMDLDTSFAKPLNLKKEHDVVFIGAPKGKDSGRYDSIKFLKENKIDVKLFGWNWDKYPEFKNIYGGALESDKMIETINQSKINLCFTKEHHGKGNQLKGKVFESMACKTFVLTEYCEDYLEFFDEGKEIVMFKDKEDLLKKIKYYLKNEKQRERIVEAAYKKVTKEYGLNKMLKNFFEEAQKNTENHKPLPKLNKKVIVFSKEDLNSTNEELKNKLADADYIALSNGKSQDSKYRKYLQAYSLEKTGKSISCCGYYVHSNILGDYLRFRPCAAYKSFEKEPEIFNSFLNLNQIMVTKEYFLDNLQTFRNIFNGKEINFITEDNTASIVLPLIKIKKCKNYDYDTMKQAFEFKFLFQLFSLNYRKKLFTNIYLYTLLLKSIFGKKFIRKSIKNARQDKSKKTKILSFEKAQQ